MAKVFDIYKNVNKKLNYGSCEKLRSANKKIPQLLMLEIFYAILKKNSYRFERDEFLRLSFTNYELIHNHSFSRIVLTETQDMIEMSFYDFVSNL